MITSHFQPNTKQLLLPADLDQFSFSIDIGRHVKQYEIREDIHGRTPKSGRGVKERGTQPPKIIRDAPFQGRVEAGQRRTGDVTAAPSKTPGSTTRPPSRKLCSLRVRNSNWDFPLRCVRCDYNMHTVYVTRACVCTRDRAVRRRLITRSSVQSFWRHLLDCHSVAVKLLPAFAKTILIVLE